MDTQVAQLAEIQARRGPTIVFAARESIRDQLSDNDGSFPDPEIWLDFANVEIVSSAELSAMIHFRLRMTKLGKRLEVCNVGPILQDIFELTRFPPKEPPARPR